MREDELFAAYGGYGSSVDERTIHTPEEPPPPSVTQWVRGAKVPYNWRTHVRLSTAPVESVDKPRENVDISS